MDVLFVCTGNICRSPMAQAIFDRRCAERGIDAHATSTGLTFVGRAAEPEAIEAMQMQGMDIASHSSRIIDEAMVAAADLVIGMERRHVIESVVLEPESFRRTYVLRELARAVTNFGVEPDETLDGWLLRAGADRRPRDLLAAPDTDDVPDPFRQPLSAYLATASELDALIERVVHLLSRVVATPAIERS